MIPHKTTQKGKKLKKVKDWYEPTGISDRNQTAQNRFGTAFMA